MQSNQIPSFTMFTQVVVHQFLILFVIFLPFVCLSLETDTITSSLVMKDPDAITSPNHLFKMGFFSPPNTTHRYLGVLFQEAVVWVANRGTPLHDFSGTVTISKDGNLILMDANNQTVWSTNHSASSPINTTLQIQDTGNLVLWDINTKLWESFSQPTTAFLASMKLSHNISTGKKVMLSSWKNGSNPDVGNFTGGLEALNIPQTFVWNNGRPHWRSGQWNGNIFIGMEGLFSPHLLGWFQLGKEHDGTFYMVHHGVKMFMDLKPSGVYTITLWDEQRKSWNDIWSSSDNECELYGKCGPFGSCNPLDSPICSCLRGFEPLNKQEWDAGNWSSGCRRTKQLNCDHTASSDGFSRLQFMKVPDFAEPIFSNNIDECRSRCLGNCSCIAYAHEPNIGCMFWSDTLVDIQKFNGVGVDLYVRLAASEFDGKKDKRLLIIIPAVVASVCISVFIFIARCWVVRRKGSKTENKDDFEAGQTFASDSTAIVLNRESEKVKIGELPEFTFATLANATDQFHENNLLGRGGFGYVYKGNLGNGKEIAVKRLSAASGQGMQEFMNEVIVISKLQHRNLVRLLGWCVEKEEKMLVYEFMPNKSLDVCFFDPTHPLHKILDWTKRFNIIEGIARGLLYLHKDSRLRIIHRDLKPSNVLLDEEWNPKISDFGMARAFGGNQDHDNTARVVGTPGYMAPEYATEGRFSEKSDVYSFGVLVLEIIKGEKNTHYYNHECSSSLLGFAWRSWNEDNCLAFVEQSIVSSNFEQQINRCIQIALLCVHDFAKDRPTIQTVVAMLSGEIVELPPPQQPIYAEKWNGSATGSTQPANQVGDSINELTLTTLDGR